MPGSDLVRQWMLASVVCAITCTVSWAHGDLHGQIERLSAQIASQPADAELYLRRAELHRLHADFAASKSDVARAAELRPGWDAVDLARGRLATSSGAHEEASAAMDRFLASKGEVAEAWLIRARARAALGQHRDAVSDFTAAIAREPRPEPDVYLERARSIAAFGPDHLRDALKSLDEGSGRLGSLVAIELAALDLEVRLGEYDAAVDRIDRIAAPVARKESWLLRKAEIFVKAGKVTEAREAYNAALTAIASLPVHHRTTAATAEMQRRAEVGLHNLVSVPIPSR